MSEKQTQGGRKIETRKLIFILFVFLFGIHAVVGNAEDYDWPSWRGPNGDGISMETNWDPEALAGGPKILWKMDVGIGFSNVAIKDNRLYTMGKKDRKSVIYCLNAETGDENWQYLFENLSGLTDLQSTPTIDDKYVYTLSEHGILLCLKAKNGKLLWKKDLVEDFQVTKPQYSFATSPIIVDELLLLNVNTSGLTLNKKKGTLIWKSESPIGYVGQYSNPVLYNFEGRKCAAIFGQRKNSVEGNCLYGVDIETGEVLWFYEKWNGDLPADPILFENRIFISMGYFWGRSILLQLRGDGVEVVWENENLKNHFSSSVLVDGYIYGSHGQAGSGINSLRCLDWETGNVVWEKEMKMVSLMAADEKLLILEEDGTLHILMATPSSYQEISSGDVLEGEHKKRQFWTPPVLYKGKIYVRNYTGDLICIDVRK